MTEAPAADASPFAASDIEALARDWITIWQSELSSYAADRETQEGWLRVLALWAGALTSLLATLPTGASAGVHDQPDGHARAAEKAGAPATPAAPDPRMAAFERLDQRLAGLEERLAALECALIGGRGAAGSKPQSAGRARRDRVRPRGAG
ncbi:MAG: hypothetical protein ACREFP_27425 [Acetobacteraceae bacterium]